MIKHNLNDFTAANEHESLTLLWKMKNKAGKSCEILTDGFDVGYSW